MNLRPSSLRPSQIFKDILTEFQLADIIQKSLSLFEAHLLNHAIKVETLFALLPPIENYENDIIQIILHIYHNALEVIKERVIEKPQIRIELEGDQEQQLIRITDNAGGMPDTMLEEIFDPYFSTKSHNGLGLGLYTSKVIIEIHCKGKLSAFNAEKGASFVLSFPTAKAENAAEIEAT